MGFFGSGSLGRDPFPILRHGSASGVEGWGGGEGGRLWPTYPALSFQRGPSEGSLISSLSPGVKHFLNLLEIVLAKKGLLLR